uniref:Uncharacterized protein n=1 Tax=Emiliania huxleyi TaxID=2903 RepID=A0A6U8R752_EMIHU|mmetsp:Transcript_6602/g.19110  ORF Transcript_6602/g.19110 Transcript_6602/m.19110 type:complete len:501 (-) Transcript_6602:62-1564(-)
MTTLRTLLATPLVLVALLAATPSRAVRLSPGAPASAAARPRFLFLYRDTLPGHWRSEVRAVADMLGFGGDELAFEPSRRDSFEYVALPDAAAAAAVARRCVLVRGCFDVWAESEPADHEGSGQRAWERLAEAVCAAGAETHRRWVAPLAEDSWCVEMLSAGRQKPYSEPAKVALMELLDELLAPLPGPISLRSPEQVVAMLEDYDDPTGRGERGEPAALAPPRRLYLGRRLSAGASRLLHDFRLSARGYLGRTTLPPELAFLMANEARARPGCALLDPFCGTCSTLLSAARFGATTFGVEVDARVLQREPIRANFAAAGLPPPARLLLADAAELLPRGGAAADGKGDDGAADGDHVAELPAGLGLRDFDAIVTDPPYGIMEGAGELYQPLPARCAMLLRLAAARLRVGGRLVFLLPVPAECAAPALPPSDCLVLESASRHAVSARMHRYLLTLRKAREASAADVGEARVLEAAAGEGGGAGGGTAADALPKPWEVSTLST